MNMLESEQTPEMKRYVAHRRFDRFSRLVGDPAMEKLFASHVMLIGLGGVGSWAAEGLARSGVGRLTIVDFDEICITNTNRQLHAMAGTVGEKKALVMAERLRKINPQATVEAIPKFYNEDTSEEILSKKPDIILDAIDNLTAKCHLINSCKRLDIPLIVAGGSGSRMDPLKVQVDDLSETHTDPLMHSVRRILRTKYNWNREGLFGIQAVFSVETPSEPKDLTYDKGMGFKCVCPHGQNNLHSCEKRNVIHGTASFVTGTFGFTMASLAVRKIVE